MHFKKRSAPPLHLDSGTIMDSKNERIIGALVQYDSTVRAATSITVESGQRDGSYVHFVRIRTGGRVTHEESWSHLRHAIERFERLVEEHVERGE